MRYAIVSDIHGNVEAFDVALSQVGADDVLWCLGDIVGYGPNPNECVDKVRERGGVTVMGNHDLAAIENFGVEWFNAAAQMAIKWTQSVLSPENAQWLSTLDYEHREDGHLLVHGAPHPDYFAYIAEKDSARRAFESTDANLIFIGHTHLAEMYALAPDGTIAHRHFQYGGTA
ncbi:MAG: metallophosphoesterase family protein, partial [Vulcanimicrobiaceae bacterium]